MRTSTVSLICLLSLVSLGAASLQAAERPHPEEVRTLTTKVADWQMATFDQAASYRAIGTQRYKERYTDRYRTPTNHHELDWTNAVLYIGMEQFRSIARNPRTYTEWLVDIGDRNGWRPYFRPYFADDQAVSQMFLALYEDFGDPAMMHEVDRVLRHILRYPKTGSMEYIRDPETWGFTTDFMNRWGWCDALFMAPPIWARMATIKDDPRYRDFMHQEWLATYELLWSDEHKLFFRDTRFIGPERTEENGQPIFWSRGNGWVLSGLALTIPHLPSDWENRGFYIRVFQEMARAVKSLQRADGTWNMGLLGDLADYPVKESSGTALLTHGLAWGINQGYLDRAAYAPTVLRAWEALAASVDESGIFGYVQPIGAEPGESFHDKTEVYAVGAFLLAGTEVFHLIQSAPDGPTNYAPADQHTSSSFSSNTIMNFPIKQNALAGLAALASVGLQTMATAAADHHFEQAEQNGLLANEALRRSHHYVEGWLSLADPETGLIPRNKRHRFWNAKDTAADNYPFMVLTTSFTDRERFEGRMLDMLHTEIALTSRIGVLPDTFDFATQGFAHAEPDLDRILFGASEYIKDGLLPLTEWLGASPWSARMIQLLDGMWAAAPVETPYGPIVSTDVEVNGEMLQTLSRIYWMTGDEKYLEWAVRLGDYYLLGDQHPTRNRTALRLRDHGCEIVSGLCELYATVHFAQPEKKAAYKAPLYEMLDRVLEVGRNEHGLFYDTINPIAGERIGDGLADTWGYTYNGLYTVYLIDGHEPYRRATINALSHLNANYRNYAWERDSSDGYADSIESALNLYNREPLPSVADWIDSEILVMWDKQSADGVIEGWHGDGNFARTSIMYNLWKTQGATLQPWRPEVTLGAVADGGSRFFTVRAENDYEGTLYFDGPRHRSIMGLPLDWPRINQFPEWFTVDPDGTYLVIDHASKTRRFYDGALLRNGLKLKLKAGQMRRIEIRP